MIITRPFMLNCTLYTPYTVDCVVLLQAGGLKPIMAGAQMSASPEMQSQCARALRNLSVHPSNKDRILDMDGAAILRALAKHPSERINQQAARALANLSVPAQSGK